MEHTPAHGPQIGDISANGDLHKIPANRRFLTKSCFHGKEGVVGSSPTEGSVGSPLVAGDVVFGWVAWSGAHDVVETIWKPRPPSSDRSVR